MNGLHFGKGLSRDALANAKPFNSLANKCDRLIGMLGTKDLNDWETGFVEGLQQRGFNKNSTGMSSKQAEIVEKIFAKHFAG